MPFTHSLLLSSTTAPHPHPVCLGIEVSSMQEEKGPAAELVTDRMVGEGKPSSNFPGSLTVRGQSLC